ERPEVVDLAVEHDPDGAIFVVDRLMARREVDDAQPAHTQGDWAIDQESVVIRAAMTDGVAHASNEIEPLGGAAGRPLPAYEPGERAHGGPPLRCDSSMCSAATPRRGAPRRLRRPTARTKEPSTIASRVTRPASETRTSSMLASVSNSATRHDGRVPATAA